MKDFDEVSREIKVKIRFRDEKIRFLKISSYLDKREDKIKYILLSR